MKAKVTGLDISEREKAWSMIYLLLLWQNRRQTVAKINVCTGQAKTSCKRREGIDANGDDEKRILTIRRDDITELGLRVGNIINIRLSTD
jgi:hypothetical protein